MRSRILLVAIVLMASACMTTVAQQAPVHDVIGQANRRMNLVLTMKDGRRVDLWEATIVEDSVIGWPTWDRQNARAKRAVARSEIESVAIRKVDLFGTVAAMVLAKYAFFILAASRTKI